MKGKLSEILDLAPKQNHQQIVQLLVCYEFPFDITRALEFALFRTYCVPSISELLAKTGEFSRCPQKRYDDTDILISEMMEWGYESERGRLALEQINTIHGHFNISNNDFLYVLSTFLFEIIRWNTRFGWRLMSDNEKMALFFFWSEVGRRMGIEQIPQQYSEFELFNCQYEREHFHFTDHNRQIGQGTCELFASWFPAFTRPLVNGAILAMMDEATRKAFGFPDAPKWLTYLVPAALRFRGRILRWLPARRKPRLRTEMQHPTYPDGYKIKQVLPTYLCKNKQ